MRPGRREKNCGLSSRVGIRVSRESWKKMGFMSGLDFRGMDKEKGCLGLGKKVIVEKNVGWTRGALFESQRLQKKLWVFWCFRVFSIARRNSSQGRFSAYMIT